MALYDKSVNCIRANGLQSTWFEVMSGVMSPDSFATGMDCLLERSVGIGMNGVSFGDHSYTDLDFADDECLLAELLELPVPTVEALATEAESLGLEVNW